LKIFVLLLIIKLLSRDRKNQIFETKAERL
jgi:hypothetical protein